MSVISPVRVQVSGQVIDSRITTCLTYLLMAHISHCPPVDYEASCHVATIYCKMFCTGILYRCACPYQADSDDLDIFHSRLGVQTLVSAFFSTTLHAGRSSCQSRCLDKTETRTKFTE